MVQVYDHHGVKVTNGVTPTVLALDSSAGFFQRGRYHIEISKAGYAPEVVELTAGMSGWYWGNLIFGGALGMFVIDPATGCMWTLRTTPIFKALRRNHSVVVTPGPSARQADSPQPRPPQSSATSDSARRAPATSSAPATSGNELQTID
jgi:hypothetical protein